jgi:hypothetical protein
VRDDFTLRLCIPDFLNDCRQSRIDVLDLRQFDAYPASEPSRAKSSTSSINEVYPRRVRRGQM